MSEGSKKSWRERVRVVARLPELLVGWGAAARVARPARRSMPPRSIAILCADVRDPLGSKGDEAMMVAVCAALREAHPHARIALVTTSADTSVGSLAGARVETLPVWHGSWASMIRALEPFDALFVVGADVMDGYYSTITSLRLWMMADLFARWGKPATIGGCSINKSPTPLVKQFARRLLTRDLHVCIRDSLSLERFRTFSRNPGVLVADNAFMLMPASSPETAETEAWIEACRGRGRTVCGINIHPMLIEDRDPGEIAALAASTAELVRRLVRGSGVGVVLLPHDFRSIGQSDLTMLAGIRDTLAADADVAAEVHLPRHRLSAPEIKDLAGRLDLVVSGRMHLAIAALGSSVPVLVVTYQGKFDGLYRHFGLPRSLLLTPAQAKLADAFHAAVVAALAERDAHRRIVISALPAVRTLARENLALLAPLR